jgi:hypothetical protein
MEWDPFFIPAGQVIPLATNSGFNRATTLPQGALLPFVISTGAQRSGEICGLLLEMFFLWSERSG